MKKNNNEVLNLNLNENGKIAVNTNTIRKYKTLLKESELIRIIKHVLEINNISKNGYLIIDDLVNINISNTKNYKKLKDGMLTVIFKYNFKLKKTRKKKIKRKIRLSKIKYSLRFPKIEFKRIVASSGGVRNKKVTFINNNIWETVNEILLCGMPDDMEYQVLAKFNSYYAMCNTDSIPVTMPNIVVIDDFEHEIEETFDIVKEIAKDKYKVEANQQRKEKIKPFDGAGLVDITLAIQWKEDLGLKYIPSSWQFRAIPGIKGNVNTFDIRKFAEEHNVRYIKDVWGKVWDIYDERYPINVILTKSQFKFKDKYDSFNAWKKAFETEISGYKRTFNISKVADNTKSIEELRPLSYQPFQTLDLNTDDIKKICQKTVDTITDISLDVDKFLKYRGLLKENQDEEDNDMFIPEYYKALSEHKELFYDVWMQKKIQKDINGFKERACKGQLLTECTYQTAIPDPYALAQYAFGLNVIGILKKGEVYSNYYIDKNNKITKVGIVRFPHIAQEWSIAKLRLPEEGNYIPHFKYQTEGIVFNIWDSMALKANSMDFDNDHIYSIHNSILIQKAEEQNWNTIIDEALEEDLSRSKKKKKVPTIADTSALIKTDINGMKGSIGSVVNQITKLWMLYNQTAEEEKTKIKEYIQIMSVVGSRVIDFAKTGINANIPEEIQEYIKDINKPHFLSYKYKRDKKDEKKINNNNKILGLKKIEKFDSRDCTMQRICSHMESEIVRIGKEVTEKSNQNQDKIFDWSGLLEERYIYNATYPKIKAKLIELKAEHDELSQKMLFEESDGLDREDFQQYKSQYQLFYGFARAELLSICNDKAKLIDYMIYIMYKDKEYTAQHQDKSILWNTFGKELNATLKGKELKSTKINKDSIQKKKAKLAKIKANNDNVNIVKDINVGLSKTEMKSIKDKTLHPEERKLLFILLVLQKANNGEIEIYQGKKNTINKSHICKLTGISDRKYTELMSALYKKELIDLAEIKTALKCRVNIDISNVVDFEIKSQKDILKNIKKIS